MDNFKINGICLKLQLEKYGFIIYLCICNLIRKSFNFLKRFYCKNKYPFYNG